jgi:hypothetical protein
MDASGGYTEYPFVAEFYDDVVPYRNRQDVAFFVEMAQCSEGQVLEHRFSNHAAKSSVVAAVRAMTCRL